MELRLMPNGPIQVHCDNKSAMAIVKNPVHHGRMKHIKMD